jgi:hypothetical protein
MNIKIVPLLDTLYLQKISDEEYFSKKYSNYISNSRLSLINPEQEGTPEKFFQGFKPVYSAAFDLGSGVHQLTLQKDLFEICDAVDKPTAKLGALADRLYPIYLKGNIDDKDIAQQAAIIDYYGGNLSSNRLKEVRNKCSKYWSDRKKFEQSYKGDKEILYFDLRSRETVKNCVKALSNNKNIQALLHPMGLLEDPISETEQAILLDVEVEIEGYPKFKLKIKSKLDHYSIDPESNTITVNDVKTIGKIVSEMNNNISRFHYNREIAMYSWLLSLCAKKFYNLDNPTVKGNYLVVSTIPQYYTKVLPMTKAMFKEGWEEFVKLLKSVAKSVAVDHQDFGIWI